MKKYILVLFYLFVANSGYSREAVREYTPTPTPAPVAPVVSNADETKMKKNLEDMGNKQDHVAQLSQAASMILGGWAASCCYDGCDKCNPLVVATIVSGLTSIENRKQGNKSHNYADDLNSPGSKDGTADASSDGSGSGMTSGQLAALLKPVKDLGYKIDLKKAAVTDPKTGETISASDLRSASSMSAAGIDPKFGDDIKKALKEAEKKIGAAKGADGGSMFDDSGGGGRSATSAEPSVDYAALLSGGHGEGINRDPAQVAGLKTNFNGEPIGVSADSIFSIIDRRYHLHKSQGSFLQNK